MKKLIGIVLILLCLIFSSNCVFAIDKKYDVTIFLLDISTSMNQLSEFEGKKMSRMEIAINSISQLAKNYEYSDKVGLRTIGATSERIYDDVAKNREKYLNIIANSPNPFMALYNTTCNNSELALPINYGSHAKIFDLMKTITANGTSTPIEYTLKQAIDVDLAQYPKSVSKHIILITDGYEGCHGDPCGYITELSNTRDDIKIDVLSVLSDNADFKLYNCIAQSTGGKVYNPLIKEYGGSWNSQIKFEPVKMSEIAPKTIKTKNYNTNQNIVYKSFLLQFE